MLLETSLENKKTKQYQIKKNDVTFVGSKSIPFQRWYPFIEGYSPDFVNALIDKYCPTARSIFDPFAGTNTTAFTANSKGINAYYSEINPLLVFLSEVKISLLKASQNTRKHISTELIRVGNDLPNIFRKYHKKK